MGISTNALTLDSSMPATASFQARTPATTAGEAADDRKADCDQRPQMNGSTDGSGAAAGRDGSASTSSAASGSKAPEPSAQTRNTTKGAQPRGDKSAAPSSCNSAQSPGDQAGTDAQQTAEGSTDFGSVMASALGRSAACAPEQPAPTKTTAGGTDSTAAATAGQQPAAPPAEAMAWFAQALMPSATPPPAPAVIPAADTRTADALQGRPAAQVAATAGQTAAETAAQVSEAQIAPGSAAPAATTGNFNVLAGVQKLISTLTGPNSSSDSGTGALPAPPSPHAATASTGTDASGMAAALQASSLTLPGANLGTTTLSIHSSVGSAAFADEVGTRVTGLAQSGITQAQLQLHPADLGPVQVHITMQSGQASVWFSATHSDTRAALEQSLPRLHEMFAGTGVILTDSGVFREPPRQQPAQSLPASTALRALASDTAAAETVTQIANVRLSLLDTYA